jgi:hypothetical protein
MVVLRDAAMPPWRGVGYIAGTIPDGLVTFNGAGAVRTLDLFDRLTRTLIATTVSAANGTYQFTGLTFSRLFDVIARGSSNTENDIIAARITAAIAPLSVIGAFDAQVSISNTYSSSIPITGGLPPYSNARVATGALPAGMSLSVAGDTIVFSGVTPGTPANYSFTASVDSSDGQTATTSAQALAVVDGYRYWRVNITANNGLTNYVVVVELEFRATVGGADMTTPSGAITKAASSGDANSINAYYMAFDDNSTNEWTSNALAIPQGWISYDFGTFTHVAEVAIMGSHASNDHPGYAPKDFTIEASNDTVTWIVKKTVTGQTAWAPTEVRRFVI